MKNKLAIAINNLNRIEYLKETLRSLERNVDLDIVDFYFYQDGGINKISGAVYADSLEIEECVKLFKQSSLPHKTVVRQQFNVGAGLQRINIFDDLFKEYEYVVSIDNDIIFNKYYIRTLNTLFQQFDKSDAGIIQTSQKEWSLSSPQKTLSQAKLIEDQVHFDIARRWEQGLWKKTWETIRSKLGVMVNEFLRCDFKQLLDLKDSYEGKTREKLFNIYGTFHADEAIENLAIMSGFKILCTKTYRHRGIGKEGLYTFFPKKWEKEGLDDVVLHDVGDLYKYKIVNNKLCIAIRTYKRTHYLKQLLSSLEKNEDLNDVDFYFYVDGTINPFSGIRYSTEKEKYDCLSLIKSSKLPNKTIVIKEQNTQTAIQKYEILNTLFPTYNYVMMLDDDVVVSKYYIKSLKTLFNQFRLDPKAGILQTFYVMPKTIFTANPSLTLVDQVQYGFSEMSRWEQGFWRESWNKIKPYYDEYMKVAKDCDYKQLVSNQLPEKKVKILESFPAPNADLILEFAAYKEGYLGLHTELPRHKGIGEEGLYSFQNKEFWISRGLDKVKLYEINDVERFKFRAPLRFAEDFKGCFKDKEVYIAGSAPSLDTYPNDFFDNKIGITLHLAYLKFPRATYRGVCEAPIIRWLLVNRPEFFTKQNIFTFPFHPADYPQHYIGHDLGESKGWPNPIFVRYVGDESYLLGTTFRELIEKAILGQPVIAGAYSTVLHSILFAIITMGAKKIHLIGCDHAKRKDQTYYSLAESVETSELRVKQTKERGYQEWYRPWMCDRQKYGTDIFIDECARHGIKIIRYADYFDWTTNHE